MPTQLEQFFDSINADLVKHFIQVRQQEHLQLEFKTVRDAEMRSSDDRRNLAKSLSGFANSSGGVVIWGVKARGGGEQYIVESSPILRVQDFAMRLDELIGQAVSPAVEGVRNKWFSTDGSRGIAVTIVPESSSGPHMAKLGENRYYKRNGESFYVLEHFDLEDMFGRRPKALLTLRLAIEAIEDGTTKITFSLRNVGRGIAKYISAIIRFSNVNIIKTERPLQDISSMNEGSPIVSFTENVGVLHPGVAFVAGAVFLAKTGDAVAPIETVISLYCENAAPQEIRQLIPL
jgi:hypothetical protein